MHGKATSCMKIVWKSVERIYLHDQAGKFLLLIYNLIARKAQEAGGANLLLPRMIKNISKLLPVRLFSLFGKYFIWIAFIFEIFLLTNLVSSLSLIDAYGIPALDVFITYGSIGLLYLLEAGAVTLVLVLLQIFLEKFLSLDPSPFIKALIIAILMVEWVNLLMMIFNKAFI